MLWRRLPNNWRLSDGSIQRKDPLLLQNLSKQGKPALAALLGALQTAHQQVEMHDEAERKKGWGAARLTQDQRQTLGALLPGFQNELRAYLDEMYGDEEGEVEAIYADEPRLLDELDECLRREHSVTVRDDGLIHFWRMEGNMWEAIGDLPCVLFHYTSSKVIPSIQEHGLEADRKSVNGTKTEGVYLTTEESGPAIDGYKRGAVRGHRGGYPIQVVVQVYLSELQDDDDDFDIQSGNHQYVVPHVPPERIVEINVA